MAFSASSCHTYGITTTELKVASTPVPTITVNSVTLMRARQNDMPRSMP
ncbi:hypothetical protein HK414_01815 [Ramlibacter terrae]|uniref:Uncharacterized protein n=1 Tax=Ramlibacter terrae TaxID=2732511 RepID=A0ABX6P2A8_9BURK|nr:hypothetical protein HK414_01815 [Ramlibacter terrae]